MIDGNIVGGTASSPTWTMNGNEVTPPYTEISVPGGQLFVGGDQPSNDLCASTTFRVAISLRGRLPFNIQVDPDEPPNFRDVNNLVVVIGGNIVGGTASSPTWTMNGNEVTPPYTEISVPGGQLFVGDQPSE